MKYKILEIYLTVDQNLLFAGLDLNVFTELQIRILFREISGIINYNKLLSTLNFLNYAFFKISCIE